MGQAQMLVPLSDCRLCRSHARRAETTLKSNSDAVRVDFLARLQHLALFLGMTPHSTSISANQPAWLNRLESKLKDAEEQLRVFARRAAHVSLDAANVTDKMKATPDW
jgi:hypothetical protein